MSPARDPFSFCQDALYESTTAVLNRTLAADADTNRDVPNIELLHDLTHAAISKANKVLRQDSMDELCSIDDASNYAATIRAKVEAVMEQALEDLVVPGDVELAVAIQFLWDNWIAELANAVTNENVVPPVSNPPSNHAGPSQRQRMWTADEARFVAQLFLGEPAMKVQKAAKLLNEHFDGKFVPHSSGGVIPFRPRTAESVRRFTKGRMFAEVMEKIKKEINENMEEREIEEEVREEWEELRGGDSWGLWCGN